MQPIFLWVCPVEVDLLIVINRPTAMKRTITAILLFAVFAVSQYARHIGYVQCRLMSYNNSEKPSCDCEKQFIGDPTRNKPLSLPVHHQHAYVDEVYTGFPLSIPVFDFLENTTVSRITQAAKVLPGFSTTLFRPPVL
jgi:hypothetical protein